MKENSFPSGMKENSYFLIVLEEFKRFSICSSERSVFHMNSQWFKGYRCESGIAIFAWRITWNYAYSPFKTKTTKVIIKLKTFKTHFLKFVSFINLPCGHVLSHTKFGPDRFSRFDVYWIQTNRHTNRQPKFIYRLEIQSASRPSF